MVTIGSTDCISVDFKDISNNGNIFLHKPKIILLAHS